MAAMTDPTSSLTSFRDMFALGALPVQRGALDPTLVVLVDAPTGTPRFTYARIEENEVTALAIFATVEPLDGVPCFQLGYAVLDGKRGHGRAARLIRAAIEEMRNGWRRAGVKSFFVEAIIDRNNAASNRVATSVIAVQPEAITDAFTGTPANRYLRLYELS
jgi:hypothetical protein